VARRDPKTGPYRIAWLGTAFTAPNSSQTYEISEPGEPSCNQLLLQSIYISNQARVHIQPPYTPTQGDRLLKKIKRRMIEKRNLLIHTRIHIDRGPGLHIQNQLFFVNPRIHSVIERRVNLGLRERTPH
jgi:hypothetical protein